MEMEEDEEEEEAGGAPLIPCPLQDLGYADQDQFLKLFDQLQYTADTMALLGDLQTLHESLLKEDPDRPLSRLIARLEIVEDVLVPLFLNYSIDDKVLCTLVQIVGLITRQLPLSLDARVEQSLATCHRHIKQAFIDASVPRCLLHGMTRTLLVDEDLRGARLAPHFALLKNLLLIPDALPSALVSESHLSRLQDSFIQMLAKEQVLAFLLLKEAAFYQGVTHKAYMEILSLILGGAAPKDLVEQHLFVTLYHRENPERQAHLSHQQEMAAIKCAWETHIYHRWVVENNRKKQKPLGYQSHLQRHFRPVYVRWHPVWGRRLCLSVNELTNSIYARYERHLLDHQKTSKYLPSLADVKDEQPNASFETKTLLKAFVENFLERCIFGDLVDLSKFRKKAGPSQQALHWFLIAYFLEFVNRCVVHSINEQRTPGRGRPVDTIANDRVIWLTQRVASCVNSSCYSFSFNLARYYLDEKCWSALHYNLSAIAQMLSLTEKMIDIHHFNTVTEDVLPQLVREEEKYIGLLIELLKDYRPTNLSKTYLANLVQSVCALLRMTDYVLQNRAGTLRVQRQPKRRRKKSSNNGDSDDEQKEVNMDDLVEALAHPMVIRNCCFLLEEYFTNEPSITHDVLYLLEILATWNRGQHIELFFQMTVLITLLKMKGDRYLQPLNRATMQAMDFDEARGEQRVAVFASLLGFIEFIFGRFIKAVNYDPMIWLESLFLRAGPRVHKSVTC